MTTTIDISLPDRYDMLARKAINQLTQIISPVDAALEHIDALHSDMRASSRGIFLILRGDSGTGKSTFIHTIGLFREDVETTTFSKDQDVGDALRSLSPTKKRLRVVVFEGREALTDVSKELLEKSIHAINTFVRTPAGELTIVAWPVNRDDLAASLSSMAMEIGAESLVGLGEPVFRFQGPPKEQFIPIVNRTLALLNQGETLHDLGISDERSTQLVTESMTIGVFLAKVRRDLLSNKRQLETLAKKEVCRVWIVVLAGNEPEADIDALTRGTMYAADIDRMLSVTNANIVKDLKDFPEKVGLLGTYLDARVLHVPVLAALAAVRTYANDGLRNTMKTAGMSATPEKDAKERLAETNLLASFKDKPIGARKVGGKVGSNSIAAFEKLTNIASTNDVQLNRAIAECLKDLGVITGYEVEKDFGTGMTRRTDILATTTTSSIRLELMWRKKTGRAEIANYVLGKLYNYGKAIGYLSARSHSEGQT
jgi:hypothetical protein